MFYVLFLDKNAAGEELKIRLSFLGMKDVPHAHAAGIRKSIDDAFDANLIVFIFYFRFAVSQKSLMF